MSNVQSLTISNLPDNLLGKIACYVEKPSRPLPAVALNSKCNWNNEKWNALDFSDISRELAAKLSDDDLAGVLNCIEAQDNLETLKLTGCVNISGSGLRCLGTSVVLQQIDLSLVCRHESPTLTLESKISEPVVFLTLSRIVDTPGNRLKHVHLPKIWRKKNNKRLTRGVHCQIQKGYEQTLYWLFQMCEYTVG